MACCRIPAVSILVCRGVMLACVCLIGMVWMSGTLHAQSRTGSKTSAEVRDYTSRHFLIHTDIPAQEAQELLTRLEKMLELISQYWGRRNRKTIEMYVVQDLSHWPAREFHPVGRQKLAQQSGVTVTRLRTRGREFDAKSVVYATADRGTPQHEAVHAYCNQTFGRVGPVWYSEGMAEMGQYWRDGDRSVNCPQEVVDYLRNSEPKSLNHIVNAKQLSGDSWQNYAWRWALCHLLANNTNYAKRFRPLGLGLLTGKDVSFEQVYGAMAREISFEYLFFLQHVDVGYRVDLCSWEWDGRHRAPRTGKGTLVKVKAGAGWQATRLNVKQDTSYHCAAEGIWRLRPQGEKLSANGKDDGSGRLMAIVLNDEYQLSTPLELGSDTPFTVPSDGRLYLRCRDGWGDLADNQGTLKVQISTVEE